MRCWLLILGVLPCLAGTSYQVVVGGLGGEADYDQRFQSLTQDAKRLVTNAGDVQCTALFGKDATKQNLKAAISKAAETPADSFVLLLIGHGTWDNNDYKFNLPGADVSAMELRTWLDQVKAPQLVVVGTSSSGAALRTLQKPGRVVITATKSGTERLAVVFARYWVEALRDPSADADKNQSVSALEAYRYADAKVANYYESQKRLATEHALLEDTGNGDGVRAPSPQNGRGLLAAQLTLVRMGDVQQSLQSPEKQQLLARRETLHQSIDKLKYEKAAMPAAEYQSKLRGLLLELARLEEQLER